MKLTNNGNLPLSVAVWLAVDTYDYINNPYTISITSILKSTKQIILDKRLQTLDPTTTAKTDISSLIPSCLGTCIHDGINTAWLKHHIKALKSLGYKDETINKIKINPKQEDLIKGDISVYMEQRHFKKLGKWTISGKFDFIGDGTLEDFKSTSVYNYQSGSNVEKYRQQGSIYRWLCPELITNSKMFIQYIFTDWSKLQYIKQGEKRNYPASRIVPQELDLIPTDEMEEWLINKLTDIEKNFSKPEKELPLCTPEELWQKPPVYAYYKNPAKMTRSTANFATYFEAANCQQKNNNVGAIVERQGQVRACAYCSGFSLCSQKDTYLAEGILVI